MRSTRTEKTRPTVPVTRKFDQIWVCYDRLNIVAESGLPLGCAHIGGKSTYAILCVSPIVACPTPPPSVAYALHLRDRRTSVHIAALCARYSFRLTCTAIVWKSACRTGAGAITPSTQARQCSNSPLAVVIGAFHFARKSNAWDFGRFVNKIDACLHFLLAKVRNLVRTFVEECTMSYWNISLHNLLICKY
jgi:hypothetical protein